MLAACVSLMRQDSYGPLANTTPRLCQADAQNGWQASHDQLKSTTQAHGARLTDDLMTRQQRCSNAARGPTCSENTEHGAYGSTFSNFYHQLAFLFGLAHAHDCKIVAHVCNMQGHWPRGTKFYLAFTRGGFHVGQPILSEMGRLYHSMVLRRLWKDFPGRLERRDVLGDCLLGCSNGPRGSRSRSRVETKHRCTRNLPGGSVCWGSSITVYFLFCLLIPAVAFWHTDRGLGGTCTG